LVDSVGVTVVVDTVVSVTTVVVSVVGTVALSDSLEVQETANIDAITIAAKIIFFIFFTFLCLFKYLQILGNQGL
jgi:amino acid transporter